MTGTLTRKNSMKYFFSKRWVIALQVTACLLVLMACTLVDNIGQTVEVQANATQAEGAQATPGEIQATVVFGPGPFNLNDPTVGLADLTSYTATLTLSFNGTQADQPSQWSHTYVMLSNQENAARQVTIESAGGNPAPVFMAEMNGVSYGVDAEKNCTATTTQPDKSLTIEWEPAGFLPTFIGAEAAGSEMVNGVATEQYTFDERALAEAGFTKSTGQVWVAAETGVVVRYLLTTTAGKEYFGEGGDGTFTWEYNLTDINQPVTIELPTGCPAGLVDAPLMPAAQNINRQPGVTIYSSVGSIQDGMAFYTEQMPALGWEALGDPGLADTMGVANFVQGDQQLTVIVTPSANGIEVRLMMGPVLDQVENP
jgi:hypothetical protein